MRVGLLLCFREGLFIEMIEKNIETTIFYPKRQNLNPRQWDGQGLVFRGFLGMNAVVTVLAPGDGRYSGMSKEATTASSYEL